jgi:proteic killer suppression protein
MISSFASDEARQIYEGELARHLPRDIQRTARRKLLYLDNAKSLQDLRIPPANRLEALHGDRAGQYSIRINDQWRVCFRWKDGTASDVEIVDYH